ncbi:uracil-DNA glycosylase [Secundilactobacillus kimchicus]|uniref:uracil-DNA glycosylase n=1 Tax=Secundilactobacillus kimchicus TaxID=528209 RepID=UPI001C00908B|nr:uracil-DNA glycosylase [Secundilactobacillus kimchicus]MBT9672157.1 uracil-DNA glycosylase [Secundilactobacillus kimchicus]
MATFLTPELIQQAKRLIESAAQLEGFVPGEGSLTPRFTIVSEAPGRVEAETGHGFMGPAGQELNTWLAELDVTRDEIYMTGAVRARPFATLEGRKRDRKPTRAEENAFAPLLDAELAALPAANDLLVPLGNTGLQRLIGPGETVGNRHGQLFSSAIRYWQGDHYEWTQRQYRLFAMFHPSYTRRFPSKRALLAADLATLRQLL